MVRGNKSKNTKLTPQESWQTEKVFCSTKEYVEALLHDIERAQNQVDIEVYILEEGQVFQRLYKALKKFSDRGGQVRWLLDGIGSSQFVDRHLHDFYQSGFLIRVYNPSPWEPVGRWSFRNLLYFLTRLNRRDHKKLAVIDGRIGYCGSMNLHDASLQWKEMGVRVEGAGVQQIQASFEWSWNQGFTEQRKVKLLPIKKKAKTSSLVKLNQTRKMRKERVNEIYTRIESAEQRVWMASPYFVPPPKLILSLIKAKNKGADVRLLFPERADYRFFQWIGFTFFPPLLAVGVHIYFYKKEFLHQKVQLIDDWALVGSTNLNHRSFLRDLEIDIQVTKTESLDLLKKDFEDNFRDSWQVQKENIDNFPFWAWVIAKLMLILKTNL